MHFSAYVSEDSKRRILLFWNFVDIFEWDSIIFLRGKLKIDFFFFANVFIHDSKYFLNFHLFCLWPKWSEWLEFQKIRRNRSIFLIWKLFGHLLVWSRTVMGEVKNLSFSHKRLFSWFLTFFWTLSIFEIFFFKIFLSPKILHLQSP